MNAILGQGCCEPCLAGLPCPCCSGRGDSIGGNCAACRAGLPCPCAPTGWTRAYLRVPTSYGETIRRPAGLNGQQIFLADVAQRLQFLGMVDVRLVMQDPTDATLLTAIGQVPKKLEDHDGVVRVESSEPVEPPPAVEDPVQATDLDPGLNAAEIRTVRYALMYEVNPRHLTGLAGTLEPWFPVAASQLRVRSALLEPGAAFRGPPASNVSAQALDSCRKELETKAAQTGMPYDLAALDVKRAIVRLVQEPETPEVARTPAEKAAALIVRPIAIRSQVARGPGGQAVVEKIRVVDPARMARILPPNPRDGFVSPTALKLAMATTGKPELSGVLYRELAPRRVSGIENEVPRTQNDKIDLARARDALDKAERCLERCRYVRWYAKNGAAASQSAGPQVR
jgi:hypothetical protein